MPAAKTGTEAVKKTAAEAPASAREVTGAAPETTTVTIEVRGKDVEITCPASAEDAPFDFFLKMEEEKPLAAFAALLGDEGLAVMRAARASIKDYQKFIEAWNEAVGLGNE